MCTFLIKNVILSCSGVPSELLDKVNAKLYFHQFGRIIRLCLRPKSRTCSIKYDSEASAQNALLSAGEYNGQVFTVSYETQKSPSKRKSVKKILDPVWEMDPDIQAELDAMNGDANVSQEYNVRGKPLNSLIKKSFTKKARKIESNVKKIIKKTTTQTSDVR